MSRPSNHPQIRLRGIDVDVGIASLLAALWDAGYETFGSCENFRNGGARIWFSTPEGRDFLASLAERSGFVSGDGYVVDFPADEIDTITALIQG